MEQVRRWGASVVATAAVLVAAGFRFPALISTSHLGYDDGVYGSSVLLMRSGFDPYVDFFASQGPLFLPILRLFDMIGIGGLNASRVAMMATGSALALGVYLIASRAHGPGRSAVAALAASSSGVLLIAAGPLQSDGLALALGLMSIVLATGGIRDRPWLVPGAGIVLGLALSVKSLHLLPIVLVVVVLMVSRGSLRSLVVLGLSSGVTMLVVTLPWGIGEVWDQYVLFHLAKSRPFTPGDNLATLAELLLKSELPLVVLLGTGLALTMRRPTVLFSPLPPQAALPLWLLWVWAASSLLMVILVTGVANGFERFGAFAIPPLILLSMRSAIPTRLALIFVVLAIPFQWWALELTELNRPSGTEAAAIEILSSLPEDSFVVTDDPGIAWSAGRLSHPATVDVSFGRIETGSITGDDVDNAALDPRSCAYVAWSGRFFALGAFDSPDEYATAIAEPDRNVAVRQSC